EQLKDLTWAEEALIARTHLFGRVFRLEDRKNSGQAYSSLKGHIVVLPQDTIRLLDILPTSPDSLADIAHVVWVGQSEPDISKLAATFTVRKRKVIDALQWLCDNHIDYQNVTVNTIELDKWPSIVITERLLNNIARLMSSAAEDAMRDGFAIEDPDSDEFEGSIPNTTSAIIDVNNISRPHHLMMLENLESIKNNLTINVIMGTKILKHYDDPAYFTASFP